MRRFYAWYLPFVVAVSTLCLRVDRDFFITRPTLSLSISLLLLALPALVFVFTRSRGGIAKTLRLAGFRILRTRAFAAFGAVALGFLLAAVFVGYLIGVPERAITSVGFIAIILVLFYLLALIWNGTIVTRESRDFIFRKEGEAPVYLLDNGQARHIPDPPTLQLMGWSFEQVVTLGEVEFSAFRIGRPLESVTDARLVCIEDSPAEVWIILNGVRRRVPDATLALLRTMNQARGVDQLPSTSMSAWPEAPPLPEVILFGR